MKEKEIFATVNLPMGGEATILEGNGLHYFNAMLKAKGDTSILIKYLMMEIVLIEGVKPTEQQLNDMHMRDIFYIGTVIGTMMSNEFTA